MNLWIYIYTILCYHIPCIQPRFKPSRWTHWKVKQLSCPARIRPALSPRQRVLRDMGRTWCDFVAGPLSGSITVATWVSSSSSKKWNSASILILTDFIDDIHEYTTILCGICWLSHSALDRSRLRSPLESEYQSVFIHPVRKIMINNWIVQCCSPTVPSEKKSYQYIPIAS